jgi:hypothetical protein
VRARRWAAGLTALPLLAPGWAHACAVCVSGDERNREAFFNTTILLSFLPLAIIAIAAGLLARRMGARIQDEFLDRDPDPEVREVVGERR